MVFKFNWSRDPKVSYPHTWTTFFAKGIQNEGLTEYRVQDLPVDRFEEAFELMVAEYLHNEPVDAILGVGDDEKSVSVFKSMCEASLKQKSILACFDVAANRIVGVNILWVVSKEDNFSQQWKDAPLTPQLRTLVNTLDVLYDGFDIFKLYNVDKYIGSFGLSVPKEYIGRGIGRELIQARQLIGATCDIKISHTAFSSDYSNRIANKIGFKVDKEITYVELAQLDPQFAVFANIPHKTLSLSTWVFDPTE